MTTNATAIIRFSMLLDQIAIADARLCFGSMGRDTKWWVGHTLVSKARILGLARAISARATVVGQKAPGKALSLTEPRMTGRQAAGVFAAGPDEVQASQLPQCYAQRQSVSAVVLGGDHIAPHDPRGSVGHLQ
jgi:hypothetical protein